MGPFLELRLTGLAPRLTVRPLVTVQVIIRGGEVRQPVPARGSMWFLKPWPLERMVLIIRLPLLTVSVTGAGRGLEPLT